MKNNQVHFRATQAWFDRVKLYADVHNQTVTETITFLVTAQLNYLQNFYEKVNVQYRDNERNLRNEYLKTLSDDEFEKAVEIMRTPWVNK